MRVEFALFRLIRRIANEASIIPMAPRAAARPMPALAPVLKPERRGDDVDVVNEVLVTGGMLAVLAVLTSFEVALGLEMMLPLI